mmetsp:Transcript_9326/g.14377  ORF Transcript_9326/g.14377 Transcript_9326/m.14377 type:complete len:132 (-) Transcript_9326:986-1381(-)
MFRSHIYVYGIFENFDYILVPLIAMLVRVVFAEVSTVVEHYLVLEYVVEISFAIAIASQRSAWDIFTIFYLDVFGTQQPGLKLLNEAQRFRFGPCTPIQCSVPTAPKYMDFVLSERCNVQTWIYVFELEDD